MMTDQQTSVAAVVKRGFFFALGVYIFNGLVSALTEGED